MKIYTTKQLTEIKNQMLLKIFFALRELHEKDNSDETGVAKDRHDELLDIALKHLNNPAKNMADINNQVYGWIREVKTLDGAFLPLLPRQRD